MVLNILHFIQLHPLICVHTYLGIIQARSLNIHDTISICNVPISSISRPIYIKQKRLIVSWNDSQNALHNMGKRVYL